MRTYLRYTLNYIKIEKLIFNYFVKNNIKKLYLLLTDPLRGLLLMPDVLKVV